jgi:hypothetical protein
VTPYHPGQLSHDRQSENGERRKRRKEWREGKYTFSTPLSLRSISSHLQPSAPPWLNSRATASNPPRSFTPHSLITNFFNPPPPPLSPNNNDLTVLSEENSESPTRPGEHSAISNSSSFGHIPLRPSQNCPLPAGGRLAGVAVKLSLNRLGKDIPLPSPSMMGVVMMEESERPERERERREEENGWVCRRGRENDPVGKRGWGVRVGRDKW